MSDYCTRYLAWIRDLSLTDTDAAGFVARAPSGAFPHLTDSKGPAARLLTGRARHASLPRATVPVPPASAMRLDQALWVNLDTSPTFAGVSLLSLFTCLTLRSPTSFKTRCAVTPHRRTWDPDPVRGASVCETRPWGHSSLCLWKRVPYDGSQCRALRIPRDGESQVSPP